MTDIRVKRLLALLRCSLLGKRVDESLFASMTDADWGEVYQLAEKQGVTAWAFDALERLSTRPGMDMLMDWLGQTSYLESIYEQQEGAAKELAEVWAREGLRTLVMKGLAVAQFYPIPKHRQCGDADVFLVEGSSGSKAFEKGNLLVESLGVQVDRDYYKNSSFMYKGLHVEHHHYCTQIRGSKKAKKLEALLEKLLMEGVTKPIGNSLMEIPCEMFNALFLTEHAKNHFLREGISLRHVCDWMMFKECCSEELDSNAFIAYCKEFGLATFLESMNHLVDYIVLSDDNLLSANDRLLLNDILTERVSTSSQSFSLRGRMVLICETLKEGWKYRKFADISMAQWLWQSVVGYFFDKNPEV